MPPIGLLQLSGMSFPATSRDYITLHWKSFKWKSTLYLLDTTYYVLYIVTMYLMVQTELDAAKNASVIHELASLGTNVQSWTSRHFII